MYRYSTILEIYTGTVVPYYIRSISVQYSILPAYCIRYTIAYSTCDLFLEIAATAATVIRSGRSVLVVMRQFVVRQFLSTYSRKDKGGRLLFLPTLLSLIIIGEKVYDVCSLGVSI